MMKIRNLFVIMMVASSAMGNAQTMGIKLENMDRSV